VNRRANFQSRYHFTGGKSHVEDLGIDGMILQGILNRIIG
jgi:hypothetical protein